MKLFASLRSRAILVILLATLPLLAGVIDGYRRERAAAISGIEDEIRTLMHFLVRQDTEVAKDIELILRIMGNAADMNAPTTESCSGLARRLMKSQPDFSNIGAVWPNGELFCSALEIRRQVNVGDRGWFQDVLKTHQLSAGYYQIGRLSNERAITYGYPQLDAQGNLVTAVFAAVKLDWFGRLLKQAQLPDHWRALIVTRDGFLAAQYPTDATPNHQDTHEVQHILGEPPAEAVVRRWKRGDVEHLHGIAPLATTRGALYLIIGTDTQQAMAPIDQRFLYQIAFAFAFALSSILLAWFALRGSVIDWVKRMSAVVFSFGNGNLDTRAGVISSVAELQLLADNFDAMAARIEFAVKEADAQRAAERRAQQALIESETKYRRTLDNMLEGCQILDFDWRYLYINAAAERHNRRSAAELLGRTQVECWPGIVDLPVYACEQRCMEERGSQQLETEFAFPDGSVGWFRLIIQPVADGIAIFSEDITARKEAEEEIRELNANLELKVIERTRKLETANRELEAFTYSVSHDLRAPLRAISGFTEILAERYRASLDNTSQHHLDNVTRAADQMSRLIDDLLQYSRVGRSAVQIEAVDLAALLRDVTMIFQPRLGQDGRIEIEEPLAAPDGDARLIGQILTNLTDNAIKYQPAGQAPVIRISSTSADGRVMIRVADNGIGIAPEYQDIVFKVFQRLHGEDEYPGNGIGLAIALKAARLMSGTLTVVSGHGHGSTFTLNLPAAGNNRESSE